MADFPRTRIGTVQHATHGIFGGKNKDSDAWEEMVMNAWFLRRCLLVQIAVTVTPPRRILWKNQIYFIKSPSIRWYR